MRRLIIVSAFLMSGIIRVYGQELFFADGISSCFHCQPVPQNDWGLITQATVSHNFNEKLKGEFNLQTRVMNEFSSLQSIMLEQGIKWRIGRYLALKSAYRYTMNPAFGGAYFFNDKHRIHVAGYFVWHKDNVPVRVQYRNRFEFESSFFWRNRLKIAFNVRDIVKPYASFEIFNKLDGLKFLDIYRYESGVKWEMHDRFNLTLMYRQEANLMNYYFDSKVHALGLMLNYSIK